MNSETRKAADHARRVHAKWLARGCRAIEMSHALRALLDCLDAEEAAGCECKPPVCENGFLKPKEGDKCVICLHAEPCHAEPRHAGLTR